MAVAMVVENPHGSQEIYERARELIGFERPPGGTCHLAGPRPEGGWRVIEVFDSEQEALRFVQERIAPAMEAIGAEPPPPPQFWQLHDCLIR